MILLIITNCSIITSYTRSFPQEAPINIHNIDVAIVLGGGSKGFTHIAAIEALEENNIPINLIVGTSAGSAIGALYTDNGSILKIKEILLKAKSAQLLDFSFKRLFKKV